MKIRPQEPAKWKDPGASVLLLVGISVFFLAWWIVSMSAYESHSFPTRVMIEGRSYDLEIADTPEERERGLGGRANLPRDHAMLFVFPVSEPQGFWMKDMRFPLDIVWLSGETVVHIERNVPVEAGVVFRPAVSADRVIELNAGAASTLLPGEQVSYLFR